LYLAYGFRNLIKTLFPLDLLRSQNLLEALLLVFEQVDFLNQVLDCLQVGVVLHLHDLVHLGQVVVLFHQAFNFPEQMHIVFVELFDFFLIRFKHALYLFQSLQYHSVARLARDELFNKNEEEGRIVVVWNLFENGGRRLLGCLSLLILNIFHDCFKLALFDLVLSLVTHCFLSWYLLVGI
jgi:hypothetical protein